MRTLAFPAKSFSNDVVAAWLRAPTSSLLKLIDSTSPVLGLRLCFGTSMSHGLIRLQPESLTLSGLPIHVARIPVAPFPLAPLKLARCPHSLAPPLVALPSMSLIPSAPLMRFPIDSFAPALSPSRVCPSMSRLPSTLHSLSRRGDLDRPFETRSLPSSLAATHRGFAFYVDFPKSSIRSFPRLDCISAAPAALDRYLAALPAMSLIPSAPLSKTSKPLSPQLSRAESPNEPRLLLGSVVYFFLGAGLAAEACCSFF